MPASQSQLRKRRTEKTLTEDIPAKLQRARQESRRLRREMNELRAQHSAHLRDLGQVLHDGVCQDLAAAAFYLKAHRNQRQKANQLQGEELIQRLWDTIQRAVVSTHALSKDLRK
jgi:signal transduction histidine kinase